MYDTKNNITVNLAINHLKNIGNKVAIMVSCLDVP